MTVTVVKDLAEFQKIISADEYSVFDFWATWCGPCKAISPIFQRLSDQATYSHIKFYKVDVDDSPDISQEVGIRAMPTFTLFKNGQKVKDLVGASPPRLEELIASAV